jgi:FkbM family methyltransferase
MTFQNKINFTDDKLISVLEYLKTTTKPIILFGAGIVGFYTNKIFQNNGIPITCFCDDSIDKQRNGYLGHACLSLKDVAEKYPDACIIPTLANSENIIAKMKLLSEHFEIIYLGTVDICDEIPTDIAFVKSHIDEIESVYNLLEDDLSKQVLVNIVNYKLSRDTTLTRAIKSKRMYFEPDIISLTNDEIFVDTGAFVGDTIQQFITFLTESISTPQYKKIIALEPDSENFTKLENRIKENNWKNIFCYKKGAWNEQKNLTFSEGLDCGSTVCTESTTHTHTHTHTHTQVTTKTTIIDADTLDNIIGEDKATFIKMDIEGAELNAILGCVSVIKKHKPKLAISVYHKKEDIYSIPLLLKQLVPSYRLYLRHYTDTAADTVLYAVQ